MGSGMAYHNMQALLANMHGANRAAPESELFDDWLNNVLTTRAEEC